VVDLMPGLHVLFRAYGTPIPQGHVRTVTKGGRTWSFHGSPGLEPWRQAVADQARVGRQGVVPYDGPVEAVMTFHLVRPKSHYGTGRNARVLKPGAPPFPTTRPDADRLARAVLDAISLDLDGQGKPILADDSLVVVLYAAKRYCALDEQPGVTVYLTDLAESADLGLIQVPGDQA